MKLCILEVRPWQPGWKLFMTCFLSGDDPVCCIAFIFILTFNIGREYIKSIDLDIESIYFLKSIFYALAH